MTNALIEVQNRSQRMRQYLAEALGDGDHYLHICSPGPPTMISVECLGEYEGTTDYNVEIIDEDEVPL